MKRIDESSRGQPTRVILLCIIAMILLIVLVVLIAIPTSRRDPASETKGQTEPEVPAETEKPFPEGVMTALPSVESVFEEWQRGEIATEDLTKRLREVHMGGSADEYVGMEGAPIYDVVPNDELWMNSHTYRLEQYLDQYSVQQAFPMGNWLAVVRKLRYEGQTVYAYHVFSLRPTILNPESEIQRPAAYLLFDTIHRTEGLSLDDFSSLAVGDPCTELFEICPIAEVEFAEEGDVWSHILLPEGLLTVRVECHDQTSEAMRGPVNRYAEEYSIHTIELIPYEYLGRGGENPSSLLMAFYSADYILLPD